MSILDGALRQLKHNDGSEGFVFAYDKEITEREVAALEREAAELERKVAELERALDAEIEDSSTLSSRLHEVIAKTERERDQLRAMLAFADARINFNLARRANTRSPK